MLIFMSCFNRVMLHTTLTLPNSNHSPMWQFRRPHMSGKKFGSTFKPNKYLNFMIIVIPFPNYFARPSFRSFALKDLKSGSAKYSKNILRSKNLFMKIKMWDKFLMGSKVDPNVSIRHVWYVTFFKKILRLCNKKRD